MLIYSGIGCQRSRRSKYSIIRCGNFCFTWSTGTKVSSGLLCHLTINRSCPSFTIELMIFSALKFFFLFFFPFFAFFLLLLLLLFMSKSNSIAFINSRCISYRKLDSESSSRSWTVTVSSCKRQLLRMYKNVYLISYHPFVPSCDDSFDVNLLVSWHFLIISLNFVDNWDN